MYVHAYLCIFEYACFDSELGFYLFACTVCSKLDAFVSFLQTLEHCAWYLLHYSLSVPESEFTCYVNTCHLINPSSLASIDTRFHCTFFPLQFFKRHIEKLLSEPKVKLYRKVPLKFLWLLSTGLSALAIPWAVLLERQLLSTVSTLNCIELSG